METIRVNMTPCEDIKTIHASQNDNEAREWGFELHNNGDKIDSSSISDQMVFKAYKGGTEEILPTNGSTPTTSPFLGDIKYPQGLLSDQEFLYRESPTEEDGNAKITDIKGNTLVWNQLVQNGNFADTSNWSSSSNVSITASNNILRVTNAVERDGDYYSAQNIPMKVGHKYYFHAEAKKTDVSTAQTLLLVFFGEGSNTFAIDAIKENTNWVSKSTIFTCASNTYNFVRLRTQVANATNEFRNVVLIDLTQMGLDITDPSEFTSLFPLPYYAYNQGTLLSFNGNGIKTVGKNLFKLNPSATSSNIINAINETTGAVDVADTTAIRWSTPYIGYTDVIEGQTYTASLKGGATLAYGRIGGSTTTGQPTSSNQPNTSIGGAISSLITNITPSRTFVANETQRIYWYYCTDSGNANHQEFTFYPQIELGSTSTSHEPYTSSTLSLPISTYFPNGMDGVGSDYDELTNTKATTRMARVDLGTLDYVYEQQNSRFYTPGLSNVIKKQGQYDLPNIIVPNYTVRYVYQISAENNMSVGVSPTSGAVFFSNANYTSGTDFKTAMSGVYLVYPLATPTETSFTTATLVTENGEVALANENGVLVGKCNSDVSADAGFIEGKIKLSDEDGDVYSNKIQLHVERKPS